MQVAHCDELHGLETRGDGKDAVFSGACNNHLQDQEITGVVANHRSLIATHEGLPPGRVCEKSHMPSLRKLHARYPATLLQIQKALLVIS